MKIDTKLLAEIMSQHNEFRNYSIGEDSEGQLIIYTGLYRNPDNDHEWELPADEN